MITIKLLLVEDDTNLGILLMEYLETNLYQVMWKRDALSALDALKKNAFQLCLLDISMPGMDGFSLARQIKIQYPSLPFLFITARTLKQDKLKAYELGAEDYITKPFDPDELICKMQVILRRIQNYSMEVLPDKVNIGKYLFEINKQELSIHGVITRLTEKESQILALLFLKKNNILRREDAVTSVYGKYDYFLGRSFDVFISRLRKLLKDDPSLQIENVFKVGFILRIYETVKV